jgi:activator-of-BECN1-regulated-autophagy protein 1
MKNYNNMISIDDPNTSSFSSQPQIHRNGRNVFRLLSHREISPRTKCIRRRQWGEASIYADASSSGIRSELKRDARRELCSWAEAESLGHLSAKYCPLVPPPRSTIAAAFSPDGKTLASTHGDHTVKIIDCQTGRCLKVLNGHRRTPWVVRFHPMHPEILASGSLDHEVRLWNANTSECIGSRDFYRPIASIAFHAEGEILAVASGHKLYLWHYNKRGDSSSPKVVLKTRRSLRAVHFHPHAAPFLLTAEVNDLDISDSSMARATSLGSIQYPPAVYLANVGPTDRAADLPLMSLPLMYFPPLDPLSDFPVNNNHPQEVESSAPVQFQIDPSEQYDPLLPSSATDMVIDTTEHSGTDISVPPSQQDRVSLELRRRQILLSRDPTCWELPFLQGWLMGQSQSQTAGPSTSTSYSDLCEVPRARVRDSNNTPHLPLVSNNVPVISRVQSELASTLAATSAVELPCTVKLRIWPHDTKNPSASLNSDRCRLIIPHAVLCSEMGAHFSPCGRYLAACVACVVPENEDCSGLVTVLHQDFTGAATSPTQHPIAARHVMYELRVYSLEEPTFGSVLISTAIRAAHCLTSIQFSPTSEHILLAYGRRHSSLLKSIVINGENSLPIYTVLEVYRVSDMELVSVLPSAEDEVNVACFHPLAGGGLVYGTKEGKLRVLQYDGGYDINRTRPNFFLQENMVEVQTYALEC